MMYDTALVTFQRLAHDGKTSWDVLYDGCVICRVTRTASFGRAYNKSQMSTRHISVWQSSVEHVPGLSEDERRALQRELKGRDKTTRAMTVPYILDSYERANVQLPLAASQRVP